MTDTYELLRDLDPQMVLDLERNQRSCGACQLCCKLVPVQEVNKRSNVRCRYQRVGKGCTVYDSYKMPAVCQMWSCAWLHGAYTKNLKRPDRARFLIDICYDLCKPVHEGADPKARYRFVQIYVDPRYRNAWRVPELFEFVRKYEEKGVLSALRYGDAEAHLLEADGSGYRAQPIDMTDKVGVLAGDYQNLKQGE